MRLDHARQGKCISFAAEYERSAAGYVNVYPQPNGGPAAMRGFSEIVDFAVPEKFRRCGIVSPLMDCAEQTAAGYADEVRLGVGLHEGCGSARRMYAKRGYIPDGSGVR